MDKPRVLYCDKHLEYAVERALSDEFRLDTFVHLHNDPSGMIKAALEAKDRYKGMVTHLPWNNDGSGGASYGYTAHLVKEIKLIDLDLRVIGYTGMGPNFNAKSMMYDSGVEYIFDRTREVEDDASRIVSVMKGLVSEPIVDYGQEKPALIEDKGFTVAETVVNFMGGMGMGEWGSMLRILKDSKRDAFFEKKETGEECRWRDPMGLLSLELYRGTPVRIRIEGTDDVARSLAFKVCSAMAARHSFTVDYERFKP